jgi:hypothetical protein
MAVEKGSIRTLTKQEIDRRIDDLIREVATLRDGDGGEPEAAAHPQWIAPAELVRRLRRFMVYN